MGENYQKKLDAILASVTDGEPPSLLLHSCCAPCSSAVLTYLSDYFRITLLYYNPNIAPIEEYVHREEEQRRFIAELPTRYPITYLPTRYDPEAFYRAVAGLENVPEGGERCRICYTLRLREAASEAKRLGLDYFTTTLSISPRKNAAWLNEIGEALAAEYGVRHLPADFKKKEGYKRSIQLSAAYGLYRQDYCGCIFSQTEREKQKKERENHD